MSLLPICVSEIDHGSLYRFSSSGVRILSGGGDDEVGDPRADSRPVFWFSDGNRDTG